MSIRTFQGAGFNPVSTMDARMAPKARKDQAMAVIQEMNEKEKAEKEKDKALAGETKRLMKMAEAFGAPPGQVLAWDKDQLAGYVEGTMKKAVYDRDVSARKLGEKQDLRAGQESKARIAASDASRQSSKSRAITARADSRLKYMADEEKKATKKKTEEAIGLAVIASLEAKNKNNVGKTINEPGFQPLSVLEQMADDFENTKGTKKGFTVTEELLEAFGGAKGLNAGGQSQFEQINIADPGPDGEFGTDDDGDSLGVQTLLRNRDGTTQMGSAFRAGQTYGGSGQPRSTRVSTEKVKFDDLRSAADGGDIDQAEYLAGELYQDENGDPDQTKVNYWKSKAVAGAKKEVSKEIDRAKATLADQGATQQSKDLAQILLDEANAQLAELEAL